ncbi:LacI family DNA-binding transcriptional regulator [Paenibacillus sp.]|uniref:LacI family DNA-binding transcriptional regulator n=1 Tax=Paenibacillus sp. TaxID=58172 RepID=UPI002D5C96FE|nr:LacI family DNA-binding transcriptional regulator [Paenibacillus sp.]HZG56938.1 LacI family DNA-binding transcriptional regulator [Paenibacillus sp.]
MDDKDERQPLRAPTLKDIAELTGFTVNTVSRALKNKEDISAATRQLIQNKAQELGYIGNALASSLRSGRTKTLAVIVSDVSNPHFAISVKEIETAARKHEYTTFILNTYEDREAERQAIQSALSKNVDGIIICPAQGEGASMDVLRRTGTPFVLIGRHLQDDAMDYVISDDEKGGYMAAAHLLDLGHREILFLNAHRSISSARERLAGYRRAHEEAGVPVRPELIREVPNIERGCRGELKAVLDAKLPFTAVFAFNDMMAWETIYVLQRQGLRVPEQISVVGFDNIQSRMFIPFPLTTVSNSKGKTSRKAFEILMKRIHGQAADGHRFHEVVDTTLVVRESTRPIR